MDPWKNSKDCRNSQSGKYLCRFMNGQFIETSSSGYSFLLCRQNQNIGHTIRSLSSDRVREHHPVWLSKGQVKTTHTSVILNHLIESNHNVDVDNNLSTLSTVSPIVNPDYPSIAYWRFLRQSLSGHVTQSCAHKNSESPTTFSWIDWVMQTELNASPSEFKCLLMIVSCFALTVGQYLIMDWLILSFLS